MDSMLARPLLSFRSLTLAALAASGAIAVSLALAAPARAEFAFGSFSTEGDARAGWVTEPNSPLGSTEQQSIGLFVNGTSASDFSDAARARFVGVAGPAPAIAPSFDFKVFTVGGSGGSARLVLRFSDFGRGELRPLSLQANEWTHVDGAGTEWDNRGGACGDRTSQTYAEIVACHPGADVTGVDVINDSGWLFPGGFQLLVDNVSYGGETVSSLPPPVLGETVGLARITGAVIVRYPGRRRRGQTLQLRGSAPLPVGSVIDARRGRVRLVSSRGGKKRRNRGVFRSGTFRVKQSGKRGGLTNLVLRGALFGCSARTAGDAEASRLRRRRRLWGSGSGSFTTTGSTSSGSVRGTRWLTVDSCAGTLTVVVEGVVMVRDFSNGDLVEVTAGHRYFASVR
jgi:hypothetical protein